MQKPHSEFQGEAFFIHRKPKLFYYCIVFANQYPIID